MKVLSPFLSLFRNDTRRSCCTACLLALFLVSACNAVHAAPPQEPLDDLANIDFRTDVRLFTVLAAARMGGFGSDQIEQADRDLVSRLRDDLSSLDEELVRRLRFSYTARRIGNTQTQHTSFTSLALLLTGPPDFKLREDAPEIPRDVQSLLGFEELLPEFYREGRLKELWSGYYQSRYLEELEGYRPVVRRAIRDSLDYFRIPVRIVLDRTIVLMPDLLGFRNVVHARNLERTYYIAVGPADDPAANYRQVQHEYLHFLIDPLAEKYGGPLLKERSLLQLAEDQPMIKGDFRGRFILIAGESLIEAIQHRFLPGDDPEQELVDLFRRGLVFYPHFMRQLELYEKQSDEPLPTFFESMISAIDPDRIEEDSRSVARLEQKFTAARVAQEEAAARAESERLLREETRSLLNEAAGLLAGQSFSEAEKVARKVLEMIPDQGTALFYLGQIAAQGGNTEQAFEYYSRVENLPSADLWVRAWSAVRVGRYLAYRGEAEEARKRFEWVYSLDQDLNGARRAAQESLDELGSPAKQR